MNKRKIIFILLFLSLVIIGYGILLAKEWISFIQFTDANGIPRGDSITECFVKPQHSDANVNSTDDSLQRKWQHHYDGATQLPQNRVDPENGAVAYSYDALNRFNKETRFIAYKGNSVPAATGYEYDLNNNMTAVKDDNANETVYQYDTKDRLTRTIYPDGRSESYTYDRNDRLLSRTDANGTLVSNVYDAAGRLTSRSIVPATGVEGPTQEQFSYDRLNRIVRAENENAVTAFVYDNAGRLTNEKQQTKNGATITGTYDISSGYDNNGNKTSLTYPSGKALSITPDALDRIATIQSAGNPVAGYTYEGQVKVTGKTLGSGIRLEAQFDDGKRPTSFKYANVLTSKDIIDQAMSWNKVDLKTSETRADDNTQSKNHEYDSAYRLRKTAAAQNETAYDIDGTDNIKQVKEVKEGVAQIVNHDVNNRNQVTTLGNKTLTYDNNGNLTKMTGNGTTTNYIYDYKNQLLRVESSGTQVEFMYDALGRRVQKKAVYSTSSATTKYVYDGNQVIEERDGANLLKSRYAYGNEIDEPVEIEKENAGAMKSYLPMQDTNGNVIGLADSTGKLIEKVNYSAYGQPTFIYDHVAPQVDQVRVADGKVLIRFSEAVDQTSAKSAIKVKQGTNDLSGAITFAENDKLAVFTPSSALPNAALTIIVTTDLEDKNSNKLAAEFSQDFTYAGSDLLVYDRVAPEVELVKLVSGKVYVTFSEELDPASIASAIGLTYATGTINGTSTMDNPKTILFTPSSSLTNSTEYTITVKSTVKDLSGKALTLFSEKFIYSGSDLLIYVKPDPTEHSESFVKNTTLFQGRAFDSETGLYYFRARYLQPELGRFLQGDPIGYKDSMNLYQSFGNNPVNFTDPLGLFEGGSWDPAPGKKPGWHNVDESFRTVMIATMAPIAGAIFELSPAGDIKDYLSIIAGKDLLWGGKLKWWEKGLTLIPFVNDIKKVKHLKRVENLVDILQEEDKIVKVSKKIEDIADDAIVHVTTLEGGKNIEKFGFDPNFNPKEIGGFFTKYKYVKNINEPTSFPKTIYKKSLQAKNLHKFDDGAVIVKIDVEGFGVRDLMKYYNRSTVNGIPQWLYPQTAPLIPKDFVSIIKEINPR